MEYFFCFIGYLYSSHQICVEKNWQGVVFVFLDTLKDAGIDYAEAVEVSFSYYLISDSHNAPLHVIIYMFQFFTTFYPKHFLFHFGFFQIALITRQYNLALTLLWKVKDNKLLTKLNKHRRTLLHILALKSKALAFQSIQKRVCHFCNSNFWWMFSYRCADAQNGYRCSYAQNNFFHEDFLPIF